MVAYGCVMSNIHIQASGAEYAKYTPKYSQIQPSGRPAQIHQIHAKYRPRHLPCYTWPWRVRLCRLQLQRRRLRRRRRRARALVDDTRHCFSWWWLSALLLCLLCYSALRLASSPPAPRSPLPAPRSSFYNCTCRARKHAARGRSQAGPVGGCGRAWRGESAVYLVNMWLYFACICDFFDVF